MDFESNQEEIKFRINNELSKFFTIVLSKFAQSSLEHQFVRVLKEYTMRGGKRTRPALLYYFYLLLSDKEESNEIIKLSIFIEVLQSFLLIHDDLIDRDDLRRGGKAVHKMYEDLSTKFNVSDPEHFGTSMAILTGDFASQLSYQIISNSTQKNVVKLKIINLISKLTSEIIHGHMFDVIFSGKVDIARNEIIKTYKAKTVKYAFELPTSVACVIANQTSHVRKILRTYSNFAGIAFQLKEDIISMFGDTNKTGKLNFSDIMEGKQTVLYFEAQTRSSIKQKKILDKYYGNLNINAKQAEEIKNVLKDTGAYDIVMKEIRLNVSKALETLNKLKVNKKNKGFNFIYEFTKRL